MALSASTSLAIIGTVLGLLVTVGGLVAVVKAGLARGTVESQEKEIASLRRRVEAMESENSTQRERVAKLETEVKLWQEAATGSTVAKELEDLASAVRAQRQQEHETHLALARELARATGRRRATR